MLSERKERATLSKWSGIELLHSVVLLGVGDPGGGQKSSKKSGNGQG